MVEIERKFLLADKLKNFKHRDNTWKEHVIKSIDIHQGYIYSAKNKVVRVRTYGDHAYLTIKAPQKDTKFTSYEYEYEIPLEDATEMLENLAEKPTINKTRHFIIHDKLEWIVDEFFGNNAGLILAEVELESEQEQINIPTWAGQEVTGDPNYFNSNLKERAK